MPEDEEIALQNRWAVEIEILERKLRKWEQLNFVSYPEFRDAVERKQLLQRELELSKKRQALKAISAEIPHASSEPPDSPSLPKPLSPQSQNGKRCHEIMAEMQKIKNMVTGFQRTLCEIRHEHPEFQVWSLVEHLSTDAKEYQAQYQLAVQALD
jgi:hypothetical protein